MSIRSKLCSVEVQPADSELLGLLEQQINEPIPAVQELAWNGFGYSALEGRLTKLSLYGKPLKNLPELLWSRSNLTFLSLVHTQLNELSEDIGKLTQLQELYVGGNSFSQLPSSLGKLSQLRFLYIYEEHIFQLPATLSSCTSLEELATLNHVTIPEEVQSLRNTGTRIIQISM